MQTKIAKFKLWLIIQLVKSLDVTPRHPKRAYSLDADRIDLVLMELRENKLNVMGYGPWPFH